MVSSYFIAHGEGCPGASTAADLMSQTYISVSEEGEGGRKEKSNYQNQ